MDHHIITYDLINPGKDYSDLISEITRYAHMKLCQSSWVIATDKSAQQISAELRAHIDGNDRLFVCKCTEIVSTVPSDAAGLNY